MRRKGIRVLILAGALALLCSSFAFAAPADWGKINWQQFKGTTVNALNLDMPVANAYKEFYAEFEKLTGITLNMELLNETDRRKKALIDFSSHMGEYDVQSIGFSNREEWSVPGYLEKLEPLLNDPKLTDKAWYDFAGGLGSGRERQAAISPPPRAQNYILTSLTVMLLPLNSPSTVTFMPACSLILS